jgi:hypothetical protein
MERTITLFYIPYTEKNKLWYKQFVGKTLNEIQFADILCKFWVVPLPDSQTDRSDNSPG